MKSPTPSQLPDTIHGVDLVEEDKTIATAAWHLTSLEDGVVQILQLQVLPSHQRHGQGAKLLAKLIQQARDQLRGRRSSLRRVWIAVHQKDQVIGRAFLTGQGFHHVGTVPNLLRNQDQLIYSRTFD